MRVRRNGNANVKNDDVIGAGVGAVSLSPKHSGNELSSTKKTSDLTNSANAKRKLESDERY